MTKEQLQTEIDKLNVVNKNLQEELKLRTVAEERFFNAILTARQEAQENLSHAVNDGYPEIETISNAMICFIDKFFTFDLDAGEFCGLNVDTIDYYNWLALKPKPKSKSV